MQPKRRSALVIATLASLGACSAATAGGRELVKDGDNYRIAAAVLVGKTARAGQLEIAIQPKGKWKLSIEAPMMIELTTPDSLRISKKQVSKADAVEKTPKILLFRLPFEATRGGEHALGMKFDFVMCTDTLCQKKRFELRYTVKAGRG
ncbi:MAG: hypothetical protein JXR96_26765 [Deltaproteobacteria bacterium]|nr:hypothetical protein [Deltaproteobacteria bacterium]